MFSRLLHLMLALTIASINTLVVLYRKQSRQTLWMQIMEFKLPCVKSILTPFTLHEISYWLIWNEERWAAYMIIGLKHIGIWDVETGVLI
jgi:hypothetical protein